jgi:hypothetical protein
MLGGAFVKSTVSPTARLDAFGPKGGANEPTPWDAAAAGIRPKGDAYVQDDHSNLVQHYGRSGKLAGS